MAVKFFPKSELEFGLMLLVVIIVGGLATKIMTGDHLAHSDDDDDNDNDDEKTAGHAAALIGGRREGGLVPEIPFGNFTKWHKPTTPPTTTALTTLIPAKTTPQMNSSSRSPVKNYSLALFTSNQSRMTTSRPVPKLTRKQAQDFRLSKASVIPNSAMAALLHSIFHEYKKEIIPDKPVYVQMDLLLLKVKSTIEREGILETVIALLIEWRDSRFIWDPTKYDNVTVLAFDSYRLWLPDIAMTNSADHLYTLSRDPRFVVRVNHDGHLKFVPTGTARTWCALNLEAFPFDMQTCSIDFESWSLDSSMMIFNDTASLLVDEAFSSTQWTFCTHRTVSYKRDYYTGETFGCIRYEFVLKRKATFYVINLIFPCATLSFIQLLAFVIPSTKSTSDRIGFGTTNLLTLVVFQTIVTAEMPKSNEFTALSKYVVSLIIISSFGIMQSVFVERMLHISAQPPPQLLLRILKRTVPLLSALWQQPVALPDNATSYKLPEIFITSAEDNGNYTGGQNYRKRHHVRKGKEISLVSIGIQSASVTKGITAGSSLLASAAVVANKKQMWKRRETKAAYLKKMTADQLSMTQHSPNINVSTTIVDKSPPSSAHQQSTRHPVHCHRRHLRKNSQQQQISQNHQQQVKNLNISPSYQDVEDEENRRIVSLEMEKGLLGRSPSSFAGIGLKNKQKHVRLSIMEEVSPEEEEEQEEAELEVDEDNDEPSSLYDYNDSIVNESSKTSTIEHRSNLTIEAPIESDWLFQKPSNDEMWAELVTRLDALTLTLCTMLSFVVPSTLFLPLYLRDDDQCTDKYEPI